MADANNKPNELQKKRDLARIVKLAATGLVLFGLPVLAGHKSVSLSIGYYALPFPRTMPFRLSLAAIGFAIFGFFFGASLVKRGKFGTTSLVLSILFIITACLVISTLMLILLRFAMG
jgi:hypothetical protein